MSGASIIINVRYGNGTYTARAKGMNKTASYTGSAEGAVDTLAKKLLGDKPFTKMQYSFTCRVNNGDSNTWIISTDGGKA